MKHMIFDFETMGTEPIDCAVVDISAFVFDWDRFETRPYTLKDVQNVKRWKLSVKDQVENYNYKVENSVIEFWQQQDKEVRDKVKPQPTDLTVKEFVNEFHDFIIDSNIKYWWSRSNAFDPVILTRLFDSQGKKQHLYEYCKYYLVRDTRTWIDAKLNFPKKNGFTIPEWDEAFKAHDSSWDILIDVLRMQLIHRAEFDLD
jgi:hypothetical protein